MSSFAQFQHKRAKKLSSAEQPAQLLQQSHNFELPQASPASEQTSSGDWRAEVERASRFGYSIARMAIHAPAPQDAFTQSARPFVGQDAAMSSDVSTMQRKGEGKVGVSDADSDVSVGRENQTGLPDALKTGVEMISGLSLDDVQVHYNSSKPAEVQALAYTQGTEIHVGPGQEQHLAHEAWHVVQQKQGRVKPTLQARGLPVNDDEGLEREADVAGRQALQMKAAAQHDNNKVDNAAFSLSVSPLQFTLKDARAWVKENAGKTGYPEKWSSNPTAKEMAVYIKDGGEGAEELDKVWGRNEQVKRKESASTLAEEEMEAESETEEIAPVKKQKQEVDESEDEDEAEQTIREVFKEALQTFSISNELKKSLAVDWDLEQPLDKGILKTLTVSNISSCFDSAKRLFALVGDPDADARNSWETKEKMKTAIPSLIYDIKAHKNSACIYLCGINEVAHGFTIIVQNSSADIIQSFAGAGGETLAQNIESEERGGGYSITEITDHLQALLSDSPFDSQKKLFTEPVDIEKIPLTEQSKLDAARKNKNLTEADEDDQTVDDYRLFYRNLSEDIFQYARRGLYSQEQLKERIWSKIAGNLRNLGVKVKKKL